MRQLRAAFLRATWLSKLKSVIAGIALAALVGFAVARTMSVLERQADRAGPAIIRSLPGIGILAVAWSLLLALVEFLDRKWHVDTEHSRKIAHVGGGLIGFFVPVLFSTHWPMLFLAATFSAFLLLSRRLHLLASLHPASRKSLGDVIYPWGLYIPFLLAEENVLLYEIPVLVLIIADTSAALIGQRYGRFRYQIMGNTRSLEGSLTFALTAFAAILIPLLVSGHVRGLVTVGFVGVIVTAVAAIEAVCPRGWDNLFIPVGTLLLLGGLF
jgi:phytol kinase